MADLIERSKAVDALGERPIVWTDDNLYALGERNQYDIDKLAIETVPSAQPERKKGKWTTKEGTVCFHDVCSECGKKYVHSYLHYNFCPNCGASMMEGEQP